MIAIAPVAPLALPTQRRRRRRSASCGCGRWRRRGARVLRHKQRRIASLCALKPCDALALLFRALQPLPLALGRCEARAVQRNGDATLRKASERASERSAICGGARAGRWRRPRPRSTHPIHRAQSVVQLLHQRKRRQKALSRPLRLGKRRTLLRRQQLLVVAVAVAARAGVRTDT